MVLALAGLSTTTTFFKTGRDFLFWGRQYAPDLQGAESGARAPLCQRRPVRLADECRLAGVLDYLAAGAAALVGAAELAGQAEGPHWWW